MRAILLIVIAAAFLRGATSGFAPVILDYDPFYHARIAEYIFTQYHIPEFDYQEMGGIPHYYPPGYHIWMVMGKFVGLGTIEGGGILTILFGSFAAGFVYLLARPYGRGAALSSAILFSVMPMLVFRSGMWTRPTGITLLFAPFLVYLLLKIRVHKLQGQFAALLVGTAYVFTHSSAIVVFTGAIASAAFTKRTELKTMALLVIGALLLSMPYYYGALPHLNFSLGHTAEYEPMITGLPIDFWSAVSVFLFYSTVGLTYLPFILHGASVQIKKRDPLGVLTIFTLILAFLWGNLFTLLLFAPIISISVSLLWISRWSRRSLNVGWPLSVILFLGIFSLGLVMDYHSYGEKSGSYVGVVREIMEGAPLDKQDLVLANTLDVGHEIAYYSRARVFITDLSDTKEWDRNYAVYQSFFSNISPEEALAILDESGITHVLILGPTNKPFPLDGELTLIKMAEESDKKAMLYKK